MNKRIIKISMSLLTISILLMGCGKAEAEKPKDKEENKVEAKEYKYVEIKDKNIKKNEREIKFTDLPQGKEEQLVGNLYLAEITGEFDYYNSIFPSASNTIEAMDGLYKEGSGVKSIEVLDIDLLDEKEITNAKRYDESLEVAKCFGGDGLTYKEYVEKNKIKDFKVVKVEYNVAYMAGYSPQKPGKTLEYYILGVNENGNTIIYEGSLI